MCIGMLTLHFLKNMILQNDYFMSLGYSTLLYRVVPFSYSTWFCSANDYYILLIFTWFNVRMRKTH